MTFVIIPIFMSFYISITDFNGLEAPTFAGLKNYIRMLDDSKIRVALINTIRFVLGTVPLQTVISLAIAAVIAANYRNKFGEFVRGTLFIPVLCSAALLGSIFVYIFSSEAGALANVVLGWFGVSKVNWLGDPNIAPWVVIGISVWKSVGYFVVIFYAGIIEIPLNLYEAAQIDGANKWQQFLYVTIPKLKPVIYMVITVGTIWSFQFFDLAYVMTAGGPASSNMSLVHQIYMQGFKNFDFGYACAIGALLFLFVLVVSIVQRLVMREGD